jgi:hypothetical protein
MWKLSNLKYADHTQTQISSGVWIPSRPVNEDFRSLKQRIKEAWMVFIGKASAFTWD